MISLSLRWIPIKLERHFHFENCLTKNYAAMWARVRLKARTFFIVRRDNIS